MPQNTLDQIDGHLSRASLLPVGRVCGLFNLHGYKHRYQNMSVDATRWAWSVNVQKSTERLVLLSLADRANEDNECYPSMQRITNDTMLDIKTVKKVISDLIQKGLILDTGERKGFTQKVRVLRLVGVDCREDKQTQKRNDSKNGMNPNFPTNEPKIGSNNEPKIGLQNLKENLKENNINISEQSRINELTKSREPLRFVMPLDWNPNPKIFAGYCAINGLSHEKLTDHILKSFIQKANAKAELKNESEWCLYLVKYLQTCINNPTTKKPNPHIYQPEQEEQQTEQSYKQFDPLTENEKVKTSKKSVSKIRAMIFGE